jgi:outer membrane protein
MKNLLLACLLILGCLATQTVTAQGRIATVDLNRVFENYWKTKQAQAALRDRAAELEKEHKSMLAEFTKGRENYRNLVAAANDTAISESERARKKKEADDALATLKSQEEAIGKFEAQARTTIEEQKRRMRDNLLTEVRRVIDSRAKAGGFSLVLDATGDSAAGAPVVLFTSGENDLTDAVLSQLNATAPPEATTPATGTGSERRTEPRR